MASSAFFAIKEAIKAARADAGVSLEFRLDAPATSARIRMACEDHITQKVKYFTIDFLIKMVMVKVI